MELLEAERLQQTRSSLHKFSRYINIPGAPVTDDDECEEFYRDNVEPAEHHDLIMNALEFVAQGKIKNLMIFMPPGSAKSTYASVVFPTWYMGAFPNKNIIMTTYGADLAKKFGRKCRQIVKSTEYKELFSTELSGDNAAVDDWSLKNGATYMCGGILSGITGNRADGLIIDDPIKGRDEADSETIRSKTKDAYRDDLCTRLKPKGWKIIIQTRWHEDDISGAILPEDYDGRSGFVKSRSGEIWYVLCLQAQCEREDDPLGREIGEYLWTDWFPVSWWEQTKANQSIPDMRGWNSLYQQKPSSEEGDFFKREWFTPNRFTLGKEPELMKYGAGDYAVSDGKGDFTEQGMAGFDEIEDLWFVDWWSGQTTADKWIDEQQALVKLHNPILWVAEGGLIKASLEPFIKKAMRGQAYYRLEWINSNVNKAANARAFQALASQGKVHIPNTPWGDALINQLCAFPAGKYDDKVDVCGLFGRILDQTYSPRTERITEKKIKDSHGLEDDDDSEGWKGS